jgi:hydroxymethylbilane synthase
MTLADQDRTPFLEGAGEALRIATRGSQLALTQSRWVAQRIHEATGRPVELALIRTVGDQEQDRPLSEIGGQGLFTRELDRAVLEGEVDLAVHSLKDLPTAFREGLALAAVPEREDPRDVLIGPQGSSLTLSGLRPGARVGTSSLRRRALALAYRSDLELVPARGNLDTRLGHVDAGRYDAILLAAAGVRRLGWEKRVNEAMDLGSWLPAPGQGALGIVVREDRLSTHGVWIRALDHLPTRSAVTAERAVLHALEAGCQLPVGALGLAVGAGLRLRAIVASPDGRRIVRDHGTGRLEAPEALGRRLAERLQERGAGLILKDIEVPTGASAVSTPGGRFAS